MPSIKDELLALKEKSGQLLHVEDVENWARTHTKSALHANLDWDDKYAGQQWRFQQIRRLIAIHVTSETGVRQLVSLTVDRIRPGGGYRGLADVLAVPDLREVLLADALAELERVRARYQSLTELARVWEEVDRVRQQQNKPGRKSA